MSMIELLSVTRRPAVGPRAGARRSTGSMLAGERLEVTVQDATITLGENMHDTGTMTVTSSDRTDTEGILESSRSRSSSAAPRTPRSSAATSPRSPRMQNDAGCADVDDGHRRADQADADRATPASGPTARSPRPSRHWPMSHTWVTRATPRIYVWPALAQTERQRLEDGVSLASPRSAGPCSTATAS